MNSTFFITLTAAFLSFMVPAIVYNFIVGKRSRFNNNDITLNSLSLPIAATLLTVSVILYFLFYNDKDFLTSMSLSELIVPFISIIIINFMGMYKKNRILFTVSLFLGTIISAFFLPDNTLEFLTVINPLYTKLIIALCWFLFSFLYRYANTGDAMLSIQTLTISAGITVLGLIGAIPSLLGIFGIIFCSAFLALMSFTWYPSRLKLSDNEAMCFGFMIFTLIVWTASENAGGCVLIFCLYFFIDLLWAVILKITFLDKYSSIMQNTSYNKALSDGIAPNLISIFVIKTQILLLFLGSFQSIADTPYSLIFASIVITIWFLYKLQNAEDTTQSFRDINRQVLEDLQDRINDMKQHINRDDNF